jgi:hypothetical protein
MHGYTCVLPLGLGLLAITDVFTTCTDKMDLKVLGRTCENPNGNDEI